MSAIHDAIADMVVGIENIDRQLSELEDRRNELEHVRDELMRLAEVLDNPRRMVPMTIAGITQKVRAMPNVAPKTPAKKAAAKKAAPAKRTKPATSGRPLQWDYAKVAEVANRAAEMRVGKRMLIAQHFGVTEKRANNLIYQARKRGHEIVDGPMPLRPQARTTPPPPPPIAVPPDPPEAIEEITEGMLTEGALHYLEAIRQGGKPLARIADRLDVNKTTAGEIVRVCRDRGILPPRDRPQLPDEERAELLAHVPNRPNRNAG